MVRPDDVGGLEIRVEDVVDDNRRGWPGDRQQCGRVEERLVEDAVRWLAGRLAMDRDDDCAFARVSLRSLSHQRDDLITENQFS